MFFTSLKVLLAGLLVLFWQQQHPAPQNPPQVSAPKKEARPQVPREPAKTARVVLISIPGLGADFLSHSIQKGARVPNLEEAGRKGAKVSTLEGVYPSLVVPSHATILSGMLPADHGITADHPFDSASASTVETTEWRLSNLKIPTILDAVSSTGMTIASQGFPLVPDSGGSSSLNSGLELYCLMGLSDTEAKFGPDSREALAALETIDTRLGEILARSSASASVLIVTDGGREAVEREFRPNAVLAKKKYLVTNPDGRIGQWRAVCQAFGGSAGLRLADPKDEKLATELIKVFTEVSDKPPAPVWRIVDKQSAAKLGGDPAFAFFLEAAPHYVMSERPTGDVESASKVRGSAGYLPQRSLMRGVLIAKGLGIKAGSKLEYARLVDVAPTIARLLGLEMRVTKGRVLKEMFDQ